MTISKVKFYIQIKFYSKQLQTFTESSMKWCLLLVLLDQVSG